MVKSRGKSVFYTNRGGTILACFLATVLGAIGSGFDFVFRDTGYLAAFPALISIAVLIFIALPVQVGLSRFVLNNDEGKADLGDLFCAYRENLSNVIIVMFQMALFIFLWTLLLVVPGIIKAYQYKFVPYLVAENPDISWNEAKELSTRMTDGEKWNLFVLDLSWIGWLLLGALTFGILNIFFVTPYMAQTEAEVYRVLAQRIGGGEDFSRWDSKDNYGTYAGGGNGDAYGGSTGAASFTPSTAPSADQGFDMPDGDDAKENVTDVEPEVFSEYTENPEDLEKKEPQQAADSDTSGAQAAGEEKSQDDRDFDI